MKNINGYISNYHSIIKYFRVINSDITWLTDKGTKNSNDDISQTQIKNLINNKHLYL